MEQGALAKAESLGTGMNFSLGSSLAAAPNPFESCLPFAAELGPSSSFPRDLIHS